jgi:penicillin-binding protein-related factor A (putative recombinase)
MPGPDDGLGKKAEDKIREWLDHPESGHSFDRFYDQMTGFYLTSRNICDFVYYKYPYQYYLESKSTWSDRFDFSMISDTQYWGLLDKAEIPGCHGYIIILFATHKRAFILDIRDIKYLKEEKNQKSLNIKKLDKWPIAYQEIPTTLSRKEILNYTGDLSQLSENLQNSRVCEKEE